jgi:hypothetical protein
MSIKSGVSIKRGSSRPDGTRYYVNILAFDDTKREASVAKSRGKKIIENKNIVSTAIASPLHYS